MPRGASSAGTVIAIVLLAASAGTAAFLGVSRQRMAEQNTKLQAEVAALRQETAEQARSIETLTTQRQSDITEIEKLRQSSAERAAAVANLRDQISSLETRATTLQKDIDAARADGTLKETRLADLTRQLQDAYAGSDNAQKQLKTLGFAKNELNDQVTKLQTRLGDSQTQLQAATRLAAAQKETITVLQTDLTTSKTQLSSVQTEAERLRRELELRPRPSVNPEGEPYRPSRDRRGRAAAR